MSLVPINAILNVIPPFVCVRVIHMSEELLRDQESQAASFHGELLGFGVIGGLVILLLMKAIQEWRHK